MTVVPCTMQSPECLKSESTVMALAPSEDLLPLLSTVDSSLFTDELHSIYSVVIINGPLGLGGPEARLLTGWADAVLFAVRWGRTRRSIARGVLELLMSDASVSVPVGSVLTQVNLKKHAGYRFRDSADLLYRESIMSVTSGSHAMIVAEIAHEYRHDRIRP